MDLLKQLLGLGDNVKNFIGSAAKNVENTFSQGAQNFGNTVRNVENFAQPVVQKAAQFAFTPPQINVSQYVPKIQQAVQPVAQRALPNIQTFLQNSVAAAGKTLGNQPILNNPTPFKLNLPTIGQVASKNAPNFVNDFFSGQPQKIIPDITQNVTHANDAQTVFGLPTDSVQAKQMLLKLGKTPQQADALIAQAPELRRQVVDTFISGAVSPTENNFAKEIGYIKKNLDQQAVKTIENFATFVEQNGKNIPLPGQLGQDIHAITQEIFGSDAAATWSNDKLKNVYDLVLGRIGQGKNTLGLGLSVGDIRGGAPKPAEVPVVDATQTTAPEIATTVPKVQPEAPIASPAQVKMMITQADEKALSQLGYSAEEINKLKPSEAQQIIDGHVVSKAPPIPEMLVTTPPVKAEVANPTDPFFNVQKLNVSNRAKNKVVDAVEATKAQVQQVVGKTLTNQEVMDLAKQTAAIKEKVVGRQATANEIANNLALRQQLAQMAKTGKATPEFIKTFIQAKSYATDVARQMQALGISADPAMRTPMNTILDAVSKVVTNADELAKAAKGVDFNDPAQATAFYRQFIKPTAGNWIDLIRYNSMLSSPNTHFNNMFSNLTGTAIRTPIQKTVEGIINAVEVAGKNAVGIPAQRTRTIGEGGAFFKGYAQSFGDAWTSLKDVMSGKTFNTNPDVRSIPLTTGGFPKVAENILGITGKALEGMDVFFRTLTEGGLSSQYAYRESKLGTKAVAAADIVKEAEQLLYRGELTRDGEGVISNALGQVAKWVGQGSQNKNPLVRWTSKLTLPFIHTGTELAKLGVEYNPALGAANMIGNSDKTAQLAKIMIGGAMTAAAVPFAAAGNLTFGYPANPKEKADFIAAGMQPYAVRIGGHWISYAKLDPALAFQLATVAGVYQALRDKKITEDNGQAIMAGLASGLGFIANQTYFKNVGDFMNTINQTPGAVATLVSNYPTQFIPFRALLSWTERTIDQYQHAPNTSADFATQEIQNILAQIPGLAQTVPLRTDKNGNPVENQNRFINAVSPAKITNEVPSEIPTLQAQAAQDKITSNANALKKQATDQLASISKGNAGLGGIKGDATTSTVTDPNLKAVVQLYGLDKYIHGSPEATGIAKYTQQDAKLSAARQIYNGSGSYGNIDEVAKQLGTDPTTLKSSLLTAMGLDPKQVEYDAVANATGKIKGQFILDSLGQAKDHNEVLQVLEQGRKQSLSGTLLVTDGILSDAKNEGYITADEYTALKDITFDQNGNIKKKAGSGDITSKEKTAIKTFGKDLASPPKLTSLVTASKTPAKQPIKLPQFDVTIPKQNNQIPTVDTLIANGKLAPAARVSANVQPIARGGTPVARSLKLSQSFFRPRTQK